MRGWTRRPLAQLASRISDGSHNPPKGVDISEYMMLSSKNVFDDQLSFDGPRYLSAVEFETENRRTSVAAGDVLLTIVGTIGRTAVVPADAPAFTLQRSVAVIKPDNSAIDSRFLMYSLMSRSGELNAQARGVAQKGVYLEALREFSIDHPSLPEQRRIVAILDEAFEAIATAKANAEKNLQNARELFDSHLDAVLAQGGDGWVEAPIVDCFKVRSGDFLPAKGMASEGDVPVYGGNGITGSHNVSNLNGNQIIIGRVGAKCGNVRHVCGEIWLTDNAFHISKYIRPFDPAFLTRVLNLKNLRQTANQAAQPVISYTTIKDVVLSFPADIEKQGSIATRLDVLETRVEQVKAVYERKLAALDELKKSLLHQAFSGALTAKSTDKQFAEVA